MDFEINNLAPDSDVVHMVFGDHPDSQITVTIDRDELGKVNILVIDNLDGSERRMVLGQPGFTDKL
jgi:hypothetical protein